jgi:choline kinase
MKSLTDDRPKCLIEYRGKPLLQWQIDALHASGINEIAIVRGYRGELLESYALINIENPRWSETQMVASLACASELLGKNTCIVSYSDIFYTEDSVNRLIQSTASLSIAYDPNWLNIWRRRFDDPLVDAETFRIDGSGRILEIGGKPKTLKEIQGQYMGLLQFRPQGWAAMQKIRQEMGPVLRDNLDMTSALQRMIEEGFQIYGVPICENWGEVDNFNDLKVLNGIKI